MTLSAILPENLTVLSVLLTEALDHLDAAPDRAELRLDEAMLALCPAPSGALATWRRRLLVDHIDAHLEQPLKTSSLARLVGLSPSGLSRSFKASFDCSVQAYIQRRRVARARARMRARHTPLAQIALDCGFADQTHFSRTFRRETGQSPACWRRNQISGARRAT